ncbi:NADH-quinone oxidoreductase subunit C [Enorma phocaeensis]|uniref:NADH-quinone oxidoreductase subunit C n=1 Tax=Enorma phocaeensis TaxID=1871019 RepID=UPI00195E2384|nr:NADH-quinone oxidoreductase subunit C [Enorma phocaeensis]MBM6953261.1 NADH-quinone oxidoreductase subunit C [Enorma phocaeensis]
MYTTEFIDIPLRDLLTRVQTLKHEGIRFVQMCAETTEAGIDLLYTFYDETCDNAINLCVYGIDETSEVPSIQGLYFAAFSYENETHDLYGVHFVNMELDFGGNFFNVATDAPMTVITPEQKAERDKLAKQKAAAAAKARKAAEAKQAAEADAAAGEKAEAAAAGKSAGSVADKADPAAAAKPAASDADAEAERAKKMEEKLANMDPEKAAKVRAALAAKAKKASAKEGE